MNSLGNIISRKDAKAAGLKNYFTGLPCKRGHVDIRNTGTGTCAECGRRKSREYGRANREKITVRERASRASESKEKRESRRARDRARCGKDRARRNKRSREYYAQNRERLRAYYSSWAAKNKDKQSSATRNYKARKRRATGSHSSKDVREIMKMQRGRCGYCRCSLQNTLYHVDHIQPLSKGGSNGRSNLQILCQPCNQAKRARDPVEFARSIGRLI